MIVPACLEFARRCARRIQIRPSYVDTDDCIQDCVVAYLKLAPQYPESCPVPRDVWLWRQVVGFVKRQYGRVRMGEAADFDNIAAEPIDLDAAMDKAVIVDAVGLTPQETACLDLRFNDGLAHKEIAEKLGIARATVTQVLIRAIDRIAEYYRESDLRADQVVLGGRPRKPLPGPRKRGRPPGSRTRKGRQGDAGPPVDAPAAWERQADAVGE